MAEIESDLPANDDLSSRAVGEGLGQHSTDIVVARGGWRIQDVSPDVLRLWTIETARRIRAVPVWADAANVRVVMESPNDIEALDIIQAAVGNREVEINGIPATSMAELLNGWARLGAVADNFTQDVVVEEEEEDGEVALLVRDLLEDAMNKGASDVHVEPDGGSTRVRLRIDGVLVEAQRFANSRGRAIVNRLKVMADMDLAQSRIPQGGRIERNLTGTNRKVDGRLETIPTAWGMEGAVLRLFDQSREGGDLKSTGLPDSLVATLTRILASPHGLLLVAGPTGAGKTTTLHAALTQVATPDRKVLTVEDPVEIRRHGVTQVQVNEKAELNFSSALRSFLRADPDVILVGEIRDSETAALAAQAALTGHLVLSSVHANSAADAVARLADLDLAPNKIATILRGVLAQRLVRALCMECSVDYHPSDEELEFGGWPEYLARPQTLWRARPDGCINCVGVGYKGRIAVGELMVVTEEVAQLIADGALASTVAEAAKTADGIKRDGYARVVSGQTSLEELTRAGL